jgi:hypothetical protein
MPGHEACHSRPSSAKVKNAWRCMPSRHVEKQLYFYFFVNLGSDAYGRGLYREIFPVFKHVTRAESWICCSVLCVLQTEQLNVFSLTYVMTALFFMCCVQRRNLNVMLCYVTDLDVSI